MKDIGLRLQTGVDIPCPEIGINIHQPSIKEISVLGQSNFLMGVELLTFDKRRLSFEEQEKLKKYSNFQILMTILVNTQRQISLESVNAYMLLTMIFPNSSINFEYDKISLIIEEEDDDTKEINRVIKYINEKNFNIFSSIISKMFCLDRSENNGGYKAGNKKAQELIDKFNKSKQIIAKEKNLSNEEPDIIGRYVSILSVGLQKDVNTLINYTLYQLYDEYERYLLKYQHDIYLSEVLAGATGMQEPENWTGSLRQGKQDGLLL